MECPKPLLYHDDRWSIIITPDQLGCNRYLWSIYDQVMDSRILHVGTGASAVFHAFRNEAATIDGITIIPSEIDVAANLAKEYNKPYRIWNFNKYDRESFEEARVPCDYTFIIDNNLKQHACCNQHWRDYFQIIASHLAEGGRLITHTQGFCRYTRAQTEVEALTVEELEALCSAHPANLSLECRTDMKNRAGHYPVIIRRNEARG